MSAYARARSRADSGLADATLDQSSAAATTEPASFIDTLSRSRGQPLAGIVVIPTLVMFANAFGFLAGVLAAKQSLGISNADFAYGARYFFHSFDLWYSAIKAFCFACAVTTIPCYIGFNTQQGAEGVGRATTQAVVVASVVILMLDMLLAQLLLGGAR